MIFMTDKNKNVMQGSTIEVGYYNKKKI